MKKDKYDVSVSSSSDKMVLIKCTRPDCPNSKTGWNYTGYKRYPGMTPCPYCKKQIRIPKEE
jgi:hypothetical protein